MLDLDPSKVITLPPRIVTITVNGQKVVDQNPRRLMFVICNGSGNVITVTPLQFTASAFGYTVSNLEELEIYWERHYSLVREEWSGLATALPSSFLLLESVIKG